MILLFLIVTFHFNLYFCDGFETAPTLPLKTGHGDKATSPNDLIKSSTTESWWNSTSRMEKEDQTLLSSGSTHPLSTRNSTGGPSVGPNPWSTPTSLPSNHLHSTTNQKKSTTHVTKPEDPSPKSSFSLSDNHTPGSSYLPLSTGTKPEPLAADEDGILKTSLPKHGGSQGIGRKIEALTKTPSDGQLDQTKVATSNLLRKMLDPATETTPTTKYLLFIKTEATPSFVDRLKLLHEGYMMTFLIEFTRLLTAKDQKAVFEMVKHTDQIMRGFYKKDELLWFGQPLIYVTKNVAKMLKNSNMSVTLDYAARMHNMFSKRKEELTPESNTILEYADMLYTDDDGKHLFAALKEFEAYPNISLTSYWLCDRLINSFLRPFRRMGNTAQRRDLMDTVNFELTKRFNSIDSKETDVLREDKIDEKFIEHSAEEEFVIRKEIWTEKQLVTTPEEVLTTQQKLEISRKELLTTPEELETTSKELKTTRKERLTTRKKRVTKKEVSSQEFNKSKEISTLKKLVASEKLVLSEELDTSEELVTLQKLISPKNLHSSKKVTLSNEPDTTEKHVTEKNVTSKARKHKTTKSSKKNKNKRHPQSEKQKKEKVEKKEKIEKKDKNEKKKTKEHLTHKSKQEYDIFRAYDYEYVNSRNAHIYE